MYEVDTSRTRDMLLQLIARLKPSMKEPEALVERLLNQYGSLVPMTNANREDLMRVPGMTRPIAECLTMLPALARYVSHEQAGAHPLLSDVDKAGEYLRHLYFGRVTESFYMLCLDRRGRLMQCALMQDGSLDEAMFDLRKILQVAFRSGCRAVVLSHNHPSGTAYPSGNDTQCTLGAIHLLHILDIVVLDHIIIADDAAVSIRRLGVISEAYFAAQRKGDPLLHNWLGRGEKAPARIHPRK